MPIVPSIRTRRITQDEFKEPAREVMQHVFAIHNDFGRLFHERVYKHELAARMKEVLLEVPVEVTNGSFSKQYFADVLVRGCGLFEFKAVEAIHPKHRTRGIHYLLLFDLPHGKIANVRPEKVEHEFVNCHRRLIDLRNPAIHDGSWDSTLPGAAAFRDALTSLLHDWGTGLELSLYEDGVTHLLGGEGAVIKSVPVIGLTGPLVEQPMRLAAVDVAFKITALPKLDEAFASHACRLVRHTSLRALLWANVTSHQVTFATIR